MSMYEARLKIATDLVREHVVDGDLWKVKYDRSKARYGSCDERKKTISLSKIHAKFATDSEFKNTVLHEIAHAIAGHAAGHGKEWKRVAQELGCDAKRCHPANEEHQAYLDRHMKRVQCPCGHVDIRRHSVKRTFLLHNRCRSCNGELKVVKNARAI